MFNNWSEDSSFCKKDRHGGSKILCRGRYQFSRAGSGRSRNLHTGCQIFVHECVPPLCPIDASIGHKHIIYKIFKKIQTNFGAEAVG